MHMSVVVVAYKQQIRNRLPLCIMHIIIVTIQETSRQLEVLLKFIALRESLEMEMKSGSCPWIPAAM